MGAIVFYTNIWVAFLTFDSVHLWINIGKSHESTIASAVPVRAVNHLLLGEVDEFSSIDEMSTLHGTGDRESPAWSALSLVLDWGNSSGGNPVDLSREIVVGGFELLLLVDWFILFDFDTAETLNLICGVIGELVNSQSVGLSNLGVVRVDHNHFGGELVKSELVFSLGFVGSSVFGAEGLETLLGTRDLIIFQKRGGLSWHVE
jgi:hypothetical protein